MQANEHEVAKRAAAAMDTWHSGHAVLVHRINKSLLEKLFPHQPGLRLSTDTSLPTRRSLQLHRDRFREQLTSDLFHDIPQRFDISSQRRRWIIVRDDNKLFPWCVGFISLGQAATNLDEHLRQVVLSLRHAGRSEEWFEEEILKPTRAQAGFWRRVFADWQRRFGRPCRPQLAVDVRSVTAILEGRPILLPTESSAAFLYEIAIENGGWISSKEIKKRRAELEWSRLDRLLKSLPDEIRNLVESKRGTGYRLRPIAMT